MSGCSGLCCAAGGGGGGGGGDCCSLLAALPFFLGALRLDLAPLLPPPLLLLTLGAGSAEEAALLTFRSTGALLERDLERDCLFAFDAMLV